MLYKDISLELTILTKSWRRSKRHWELMVSHPITRNIIFKMHFLTRWLSSHGLGHRFHRLHSLRHILDIGRHHSTLLALRHLQGNRTCVKIYSRYILRSWFKLVHIFIQDNFTEQLQGNFRSQVFLPSLLTLNNTDNQLYY